MKGFLSLFFSLSSYLRLNTIPYTRYQRTTIKTTKYGYPILVIPTLWLKLSGFATRFIIVRVVACLWLCYMVNNFSNSSIIQKDKQKPSQIHQLNSEVGQLSTLNMATLLLPSGFFSSATTQNNLRSNSTLIILHLLISDSTIEHSNQPLPALTMFFTQILTAIAVAFLAATAFGSPVDQKDPKCRDVSFTVTASASVLDLSPFSIDSLLNTPISTLFANANLNFNFPVSGTFKIGGTYCVPNGKSSGHGKGDNKKDAKTLQILVHGSSYTDDCKSQIPIPC